MNHVVHLPEYRFLGISGRDAVKFFQGYTTCELNNLDPHRSGIGATCNLKGRMLASYRVIPGPEGLLIRMDRQLIDPIIEFLQKYIVFSKATLENLSDRYHCYGYIFNEPDPGAEITCPQAKDLWHTSAMGPVICVDEGTAQNPEISLQRCELWLDSTLEKGSTEPATNAIPDLWHNAEISQGLAWVTAGTTEEFLPQMLNYDKINAISFEKGCYLGQEIVARMQYRVALKRKLFRGAITTPGSVPWSIGDNLLNREGRTVGSIVSTSQRLILAVVQAQDKQSTDTPEISLQLATGDNITLSEVG